ncbi:MAG: DUF2283 domain-containing protein [Tepidisphaeraceae bacterium]|jgi:uncharacterized protein YuzE
MKRSKLKFEYDRDVDAAYLSLARGKVRGSEEVQPGVVVDFDSEGQILGVEILRFSGRFLNQAKLKPIAASRGKSLRKSA